MSHMTLSPGLWLYLAVLEPDLLDQSVHVVHLVRLEHRLHHNHITAEKEEELSEEYKG